jgi:hypothetical protein
MDSLLIALPGLLLSLISALPLGLGTLAALRHLRSGARSAYLRNLSGSIAAGLVVLALLWGSLFGDDLSSSSTAGLVFLFAPIYAAAAQGIVYGIGASVIKQSTIPEAISLPARRALLVPVLMLAVLLFGLVKISVGGNDLAVAERASNPDTLHRLFEESRTGKADSFGVPLFLAQNRKTPSDILVELAKHEHPAVRAQVAQNPQTPEEVVESLRNDCASFVREFVEKRLGPNKALQPTQPPSGGCAAER